MILVQCRIVSSRWVMQDRGKPTGGVMYELKSSEFFDVSPANAPAPPGTLVRTVDVQPGLAVSLVSLQPQRAFQMAALNDSDHLHFSCQLRGMTEVVQGGPGGETRGLHANSLLTPAARPASAFA